MSLIDLNTPIYLINNNHNPPTIDMEFTEKGEAIIYSDMSGDFRIDLKEAEKYDKQEVLRFPTPVWEKKEMDGKDKWMPITHNAPRRAIINALYKRAFVEVYFEGTLKDRNFTLVHRDALPKGIKKAPYIPV